MNGKVSYESILARMLASAPGGVDVGEGSIFYDAVVPAAKELAAMYERLGNVMNDAFPDTCGEEALLRHAESLGVKRKAATCAVVSARVNKKLPGGSRFLLGRHVYVLGDYIDEYTIGRYRYRLVCETAGSEANLDVGEALLPLSYIEGLTFCECEKLLEAGRDEEDRVFAAPRRGGADKSAVVREHRRLQAHGRRYRRRRRCEGDAEGERRGDCESCGQRR